jgi:N-acetylneuraminate synthase/N,N'-diacetyllegionaminate synthase
LDRTLQGPDHVASLEPEELKAMVKALRNIELALSGDGQKMPSDSETKHLDSRKSIHLKKFIKGMLFPKDIISLRQEMEFLNGMGKIL